MPDAEPCCLRTADIDLMVRQQTPFPRSHNLFLKLEVQSKTTDQAVHDMTGFVGIRFCPHHIFGLLHLRHLDQTSSPIASCTKQKLGAWLHAMEPGLSGFNRNTPAQFSMYTC